MRAHRKSALEDQIRLIQSRSSRSGSADDSVLLNGWRPRISWDSGPDRDSLVSPTEHIAYRNVSILGARAR